MTDIVLDRHPEGPVAARFVSARLASFLYKPAPEPEVVDAMATAFLAANYDIKALVRALLLRPEFSDGPGLTIKSPAEYVAGTMRLLRLTGAPMPTSQPRRNNFDEMASACADMGQELFEPPDVSGWKGGAVWANTAATLARYNFAARIGKVVTDNAVRTVLDMAGGQPRDTARCGCSGSGCCRCSRRPRRPSTGTSKRRRRPRPIRGCAPGGSSRSCWPLPTST